MNTALDAAENGGPIFVVGGNGTGRTTFCLQLINLIKSEFIWIIGSKALSNVPFSTLSMLATQLSATPMGTAPTDLVTGIGQATKENPQWILLDQAEHVDEQSAAVLRQFCATGQIHLIIATGAARSMPAEFQSLISSPGFLRIDLEPLTYDDAHLMLTSILGGEVNSSTVTTLLEHSGGHALHLRELVLDAKATGALTTQQGYWTLSRTWKPQGKRTNELIHARLHEQPPHIRETLELLAITGPLPLAMAHKLVGPTIYEAIDTALVQVDLVSQDPATGVRSERVRLSSGLSAQLVVNSIGVQALQKHMATINGTLSWDEFDPETRSQYTQHRLDVGLEVPIAELLVDVEQVSRARNFTQVIALTDALDQERIEASLELEGLLIARAEALYELGMPEAGLALLEKHLPAGTAGIRFLAAKIAYASLGRLDIAEKILEAGPGDPTERDAYLLLIRSRANKVSDYTALLHYSQMPAFRAEIRAAFRAHALIEMSFAGLAEDALAAYIQFASSPEFGTWGAAARTELFLALPPIIFALGMNPAHLAQLPASEELQQGNTDHSNVLVALAMGDLESGLASKALSTFEQAIGLLAVGDRFLIKGFASGLAAYSAILVGDEHKATHYLQMYRSEPEVSGQILRPVAERCVLSVIAALEGPQAAQLHLQKQLSQAREFGRKNLVMRLLLEAWQCGVSSDAAELSLAAEQVQGPLAATLAGYAAALADPSEANVGELVNAHLEAGQKLLAAQLAARASHRARALGRRKTATNLFSLYLEISQSLGLVNTPALGRARINESMLTDREYAICTRAANGASNQQISMDLFLSPRTVEGHLQRAYAKLGVTDRRQLIVSPDAKQPADANHLGGGTISLDNARTAPPVTEKMNRPNR